jgi:hypothetical protein
VWAYLVPTSAANSFWFFSIDRRVSLTARLIFGVGSLFLYSFFPDRFGMSDRTPSSLTSLCAGEVL